jgi:hypothetical protein
VEANTLNYFYRGKNGGYTGTRTWDPIIMSDVL